MIKKILLIALVVILAVGLWNSFSKGIVVPFGLGGNAKADSYTTLISLAEQLQDKKKSLQKINDVDYPSQLKSLEAQKSAFKNWKAEYDNLAAQASVEDIRALNQTKVYLLDYIWMKIGTYAQDNDVKVLIDTASEKDKHKINFDVSGQYIAVINFIYDLQKDSELAFNIDNIVMQGGSSDAVTKAKFYVLDINVVTEETKDD